MGTAGAGTTVLVADDDRSVREMIRTVLELDGYKASDVNQYLSNYGLGTAK